MEFGQFLIFKKKEKQNTNEELTEPFFSGVYLSGSEESRLPFSTLKLSVLRLQMIKPSLAAQMQEEVTI